MFNHTSNYVHRSTDEGQTWRIVSPDLTVANAEMLQDAGGPITKDQTGVEVYATIFVFEESPSNAGELWAGTDDGRVQITRDDGATWTEITPPDRPHRPGTIVQLKGLRSDGCFQPMGLPVDPQRPNDALAPVSVLRRHGHGEDASLVALVAR